MSNLLRSLKHALRAMARQPASSLLVVLTLGIGIGASTAIFSVVDAVLLQRLPYEEPERLVFLWNRLAKGDVDKSAISAATYLEMSDQTQQLDELVGFYVGDTSLTVEGSRPVPINLGRSSPNLFSTLGVELLLGEMFGPEHVGLIDRRMHARDPDSVLPTLPLILSYDLWQSAYGGDPEILGRNVVVHGQPMYVRGVTPKDFRIYLPADAPVSDEIDAWGPIPVPLETIGRRAQFMCAIGRLKPGVTLGDVQGEMDAIAAWQRENFDFEREVGMEIRVIPMLRDVTAHVRPYLTISLVAAGLVLLLMGFNVANLLLLRNAARSKEVCIRASLGGRPHRLVAERLAESTGLVVLGCGFGLLLAHWGVRLLLAMQLPDLPRVADAGLNGPVLAVSLALALVVALVCGLPPALQLMKTDLARVLTDWTGTGTLPARRFRKLLVGGEIALSLLLLIGAGLVLRTSTELSRVDPGFRADRVLTARIVLPWARYNYEEKIRFYKQLIPHIAAIPGVEAASGVEPLPLSESREAWFGPWSAEGMNPELWDNNQADYRQTMPGYFEAMGIRLIQGRYFTEADNEATARPVVVVDEVLARRAWPGEDPLGKRLLTMTFIPEGGYGREWMDVVGVVEHVRDDLTQEGAGAIYGLVRFYSYHDLSLTLRSATSDPLSLVDPLWEAVLEMDPELPLSAVRLMQDYVDQALAPTAFALSLISLLALIAVILAAVGLYGVISSAVQDRHQEIGIRMALGAGSGTIVRMVLGQAMGLAIGGVVVGLVAAFFLTRGLTSLLFGVTPTDPATFAVIAVAQVVIALLASVVPAWRATRVNAVLLLHKK